MKDGFDPEKYLYGVANDVATKTQHQLTHDEAFQVAYLAGLQQLRATQRKRQRPSMHIVKKWMRQSLYRQERFNRFRPQRENAKTDFQIVSNQTDIRAHHGDQNSIDAIDFVHAFMPLLPEHQHIALQLVFMQTVAHDQAAKACGCTIKALQQRVRDAIDSIRQIAGVEV